MMAAGLTPDCLLLLAALAPAMEGEHDLEKEKPGRRGKRQPGND
jgi:hypothetical protein